MPKPVRISEAELSAMRVLWAEPGLAARDVHATLSDSTNWSAQTVKTLLTRLVDKGALRTVRDGRRFLYHPEVAQDDYAGAQARSLFKRLFAGRAAPLVAHLVEDAPLSDSDLAELDALVARLKRERGQ